MAGDRLGMETRERGHVCTGVQVYRCTASVVQAWAGPARPGRESVVSSGKSVRETTVSRLTSTVQRRVRRAVSEGELNSRDMSSR